MERARKDSSRPSRWGSPWKWLLQLVLPLAGGASLLAGLLYLAERARQDLHDRGSHTLTFGDVECTPPPGLTRQEFLEEVQYLAGLPDRLDLLADDTTARLEQGLAAHPWVERVVRVERLPGGRVRAELEHRVPVLWVARPGRAVDGRGVLLPVSASQQGLPVLNGEVKPPRGRPGQRWGDREVSAAARVVALLRPDREALGLDGCTVESAGGRVTLRTARARIVWGSPPGREQPGEPDVETKRARLRSTRGGEIDLSR
jgi:hypothetical protein